MTSEAVQITDFRRQIPGDRSGHWHVFPMITTYNQLQKKIIWEIRVGLMNCQTGNYYDIQDEYYDHREPLPDGYSAVVITYSGQQGGTINETSRNFVSEPRNVGTRSYTNVFCAALRDAFTKYRKQINAKSRVNVGQVKLYPPMLANRYNDKHAHEQVYVQPKFDGNRAVAVLNETAGGQEYVELYSRGLKEWPGHDDVRNELLPVLRHYHDNHGVRLYVDGELYDHGRKLQELGEMRRKSGATGIDFMIFDVFDPDRPNMKFSQRWQIVEQMFGEFDHWQRCVKTATYHVQKHSVNDCWQQFVNQGYEGAIVRNDTAYQYSYRNYHTNHMLKIKRMLDDEYRIVNYTEGSGKDKGLLLLVCQTESGKRFNSRPAVPFERRRELFARMPTVENNGSTHFQNHWQDRLLTIYYEEKSKDGVPLYNRNQLEVRLPDY